MKSNSELEAIREKIARKLTIALQNSNFGVGDSYSWDVTLTRGEISYLMTLLNNLNPAL